MSRYLGKLFLTAIIGHLAGILILFLLSCMGTALDNPSAAILPSSFVALGMGAVVAGLLTRRASGRVPGAILTGVFYGFLPFVVSLFGKSSFFTWGTRLLVFFAAAVLVAVVALLFPQKRRRKRSRKAPFPVKR